jgi:GNAT superfamily N-acetyltransferase
MSHDRTGQKELVPVGMSDARVFYDVFDRIFAPIWTERDKISQSSETHNGLNPYFRYIINTVLDRFTSVDAVKSGRLWVLLSREYNIRNYFILLEKKHCGFCSIRRLSETSWRLGPFGVLHEYRGLGLGKFMVEEVNKIVRDEGGKYIVTGVVVKQTHDMFLKMGFRDVDEEWNMALDV